MGDNGAVILVVSECPQADHLDILQEFQERSVCRPRFHGGRTAGPIGRGLGLVKRI